jgi:uncharacterized protein (DUF58 family)
MRPRLTARGIGVLLLGCTYALAGILIERPFLVSLGGAALCLLAVERVRAAARVARLAAGDLRLSWRVVLPEGRRAIEAERPFHVAVRLATEGPALGWARLGAYASAALEVEDIARTALVPGPVEAHLVVRARGVGTWWLHGGLLTISGSLFMFVSRAFFPTPLRVRVLPAVATARLREPAALVAGSGRRPRRAEGPGSDLAEIREAAPGDSFRHVAWKATARTGRLMVRRFQTETPVDHCLCLDLAMRPQRALDRAIGELCAYARAALVRGDRVGLVLFYDRVRAEVPPGESVRHMRHLLDVLLRARSEPDDAMLSDAEAVAAAARYLSWQEGAELRVTAPALDSARWAELGVGPSGELYDVKEIDRLASAILAREAPARLAAAPRDIDRTRLLLRVRGVEMPPRDAPPLDARLVALEAALRLAEREARCRISLWTDLDTARLAHLPAMRRARRHGLLPFRPRRAAA